MLDKFIAEVKSQGLARSNRYLVKFTPPLSGLDSSVPQTLSLFCDQVQLPGMNFSTAQNRTFGEFREVPYEKLFDNLNMSFYVDKNMYVKRVFDNWMEAIQNPETRTFNYYKNYTTGMDIEVHDLMDRITYVVSLWECYPKTIGAIQMDYASKDVMKLSVTMQYKYWTSQLISQNNKSEPSLQDRPATPDNFMSIEDNPNPIFSIQDNGSLPERQSLETAIVIEDAEDW
jgi:hypothetical protein